MANGSASYFMNSVSNPKLAIVLSVSASGLHVKLFVRSCEESPTH